MLKFIQYQLLDDAAAQLELEKSVAAVDNASEPTNMYVLPNPALADDSPHMFDAVKTLIQTHMLCIFKISHLHLNVVCH